MTTRFTNHILTQLGLPPDRTGGSGGTAGSANSDDWFDVGSFDVSSMVAGVAPLLGRLMVVGIVAAIASQISRHMVGQIEDIRMRRQLLFFAPKVVWTFVALIGMDLAGIDVSGAAALLAAIGVTGTVVFTPVGQNYVAGAMTTIDNLFTEGEVITVGDTFGRVMFQSVLRTELELPDGTKAWIPNAIFQEQEVFNHSRMGGYRISVDVPLDGSPDRALAVGVMESVLHNLWWNASEKPAYVVFDHVGGEAMFFKAYAWIEDRTTEPYYQGLLLTSLVDALEEAGVSVGQTTNLSFAHLDAVATGTDITR